MRLIGKAFQFPLLFWYKMSIVLYTLLLRVWSFGIDNVRRHVCTYHKIMKFEVIFEMQSYRERGKHQCRLDTKPVSLKNSRVCFICAIGTRRSKRSLSCKLLRCGWFSLLYMVFVINGIENYWYLKVTSSDLYFVRLM